MYKIHFDRAASLKDIDHYIKARQNYYVQRYVERYDSGVTIYESIHTRRIVGFLLGLKQLEVMFIYVIIIYLFINLPC